jgi:hypothetical protein
MSLPICSLVPCIFILSSAVVCIMWVELYAGMTVCCMSLACPNVALQLAKLFTNPAGDISGSVWPWLAEANAQHVMIQRMLQMCAELWLSARRSHIRPQQAHTSQQHPRTPTEIALIMTPLQLALSRARRRTGRCQRPRVLPSATVRGAHSFLSHFLYTCTHTHTHTHTAHLTHLSPPTSPRVSPTWMGERTSGASNPYPENALRRWWDVAE